MDPTASELPFLDFETVDVLDDASCTSDLSDFDVMAAAQQQQKRRSSMHRAGGTDGDDVAEDAENTHNPQEIENVPEVAFDGAASMDCSSPRGRSMAKPQSRLPVSARFLQPTQSAAVKARPAPKMLSPARPRSASVEKKLTIPVSPKLRCVSRSRDRIQSTAEREEQQIEEARKNEALRKKKNQRAMELNKAKSNLPVHNVTRSIKPLTIPTTPFNHLSKRHGEKKYSTTFVSKPDRPKSAPQTGPKSVTQPEPFNLRTDARAGAIQQPVEAVLTAGELNRKFEADPRSHRVPRVANHLTEAVSPKLSTKLRASSTGRPRPKSREEIESELVEEATRHPFRAKPVDKRIFSSLGELGVPKVAAKPATTCEEFFFHYTAERVAQRQQHLKKDDCSMEEHFEFKAAPMPDFSAAAQPAPPKPLTAAFSPKFQNGRRSSSAPPRRQLPHHAEIAKDAEAKEREDRHRFSRPMKLTEPEEFHFSTAERGTAARAMFNHRLQEELTAEMKKRNFKASEAKFNRASFVPQPSTKELTEFKEFHLKSDDRHTRAAAKKAKEDELRNAIEMEEKIFHARPLPKAVIDPSAVFKINKDQKHLTKPETVLFATDQRMKKRKIFEKELARKRKAQAEQQQKLDEEKEKSEIENLNLLRRKPIAEGGMCFKATSVPGSARAACTKMRVRDFAAENSETSNPLCAFSEHSLNVYAATERSCGDMDEGL